MKTLNLNAAMKMMLNYPWPGNVRELENAVEHGIICAQGESVGPESLPQHIQDFSQHNRTNIISANENTPDEKEQRQEIEQALNETNAIKLEPLNY